MKKVKWVLITLYTFCIFCNAFNTGALLGDASMGGAPVGVVVGMFILFGVILCIIPSIMVWYLLSGRADKVGG